MKVLIVALNSKYIHSSLAAWYLKAVCGDECGKVLIAEYTINDIVDNILAGIYQEKADVVAFSCYIWNISFVLSIAENLKKVSRQVKIILGGPEVSYDSKKLLEDNPQIDYILSGEGENTFKLLLKHIDSGGNGIESISGLTYRAGSEVKCNEGFMLVDNLDGLPSPYTDEMLSTLVNRIVYYESSRGCPFFCSYCISSTFKGIRYFSLERVRRDMDRLMSAGVKQVKFVDRTFNCNLKRAKHIISYIIEKVCEIRQKDPSYYINFHFEVAADLFDEELFDILSKSPKGIIQFEIGVQTTNSRTLELVSRKTDVRKVFYSIGKLKSLENMHLHLDLIAGLPEEDYCSFRNSFNEVYALRPEQLQLGFLKMLKGSRIRLEASRHEYVFRAYPPYEILGNKYLRFDELLKLKRIEDVLEKYYNSRRFVKTLEFLLKKLVFQPFDFFRELSEHMRISGASSQKLSSRQLYTILYDFLKTLKLESKDLEIAGELLKLDYLSSDNSNNLPQGLNRVIVAGFKEKCFDFLKNEENIKKQLCAFIGIPAKQIFKQVHFEVFNYDITVHDTENIDESKKTAVIFDYRKRDEVTGLYEYIRLENFPVE